MNLVWSPEATENVESLHAYIAKDSRTAADRQLDRIVAAVGPLRDHPELGRKGRVGGTRELVIPGTPYIAVYEVVAETIYILDVRHGAQLWPRHFPSPEKKLPPQRVN